MDIAKLRICFLAGTLGQGGAERQLCHILAALRGSGTRPHLLCLTRGEFHEESIRALGVPVTWVGHSRSRLARAARIIGYLRRHRADIIQSQHFYTNLYVALAGRVLGLREIGAMRSDGLGEVQASGGILGRLCLYAPRFIAANSRTALCYARGMGVSPRRLGLLPNVVDAERFRPPHERATGPVRLLVVGRLTRPKRLDRFISAFARVRQTCPGIVATIAGDGPLRGELEEQALDLGLLPEALEFRGAVADMPAMYQSADVLVLSSDREGTPNALLEAMACGLPVVATRVGGVPDVVREGQTGYVVDADDEVALADAVVRIATDRQLRMALGQQGREYVEQEHALHRLPALLTDLYSRTAFR